MWRNICRGGKNKIIKNIIFFFLICLLDVVKNILGNFRGEFLFYMSDFTLNDVMKSNEIEGYC